MTDQCEHRRQSARVEKDAPEPYTYYCRDCGETTSRTAELDPLYGIPYYRTTGTEWWMNLERPGVRPLMKAGDE